jgi:hypothetical protein
MYVEMRFGSLRTRIRESLAEPLKGQPLNRVYGPTKTTFEGRKQRAQISSLKPNLYNRIFCDPLL